MWSGRVHYPQLDQSPLTSPTSRTSRDRRSSCGGASDSPPAHRRVGIFVLQRNDSSLTTQEIVLPAATRNGVGLFGSSSHWLTYGPMYHWVRRCVDAHIFTCFLA